MAEYIVDTTDGILHSRTTGELLLAGKAEGRMQEKEGRMSDFDLSETVGELENMVNAAWDAGYAKGVDWAKKCGGGIDAMTDAELAEHGLVRLPVDADGVTWTGEEQYAKFKGCPEFHIGDKVIRKNGRIGTVIGGAIGKDGKHCLVLSMHDSHWRTYLCPIDEARKLNTGLDFEAEA